MAKALPEKIFPVDVFATLPPSIEKVVPEEAVPILAKEGDPEAPMVKEVPDDIVRKLTTEVVPEPSMEKAPVGEMTLKFPTETVSEASAEMVSVVGLKVPLLTIDPDSRTKTEGLTLALLLQAPSVPATVNVKSPETAALEPKVKVPPVRLRSVSMPKSTGTSIVWKPFVMEIDAGPSAAFIVMLPGVPLLNCSIVKLVFSALKFN